MKNRTWKYSKHGNGHARTLVRWLTVSLLGAGLVATAQAGPREQAKRIHDRLAGVPPTEAVLQSMETDILAGNALAAAQQAMQNPAACSFP